MIEKKVHISVDIAPSSAEPSELTTRLLQAARQAAHKAYAPYSKFRVGAAALLSNGTIVTGNNQENAAYPSGLCAERVTIFSANAQYPDESVTHLLICAETDNGPVGEPVTPCGACRQVIIEKQHAQGSPITVLLAGNDVVYQIDNAADLVPLSFISDSLKGE